MIPRSEFLNAPKSFWAHVRSISEKVGYTERESHTILVPTPEEIRRALDALSLKSEHVVVDGTLTEFGRLLHGYFEYRADALNTFVRPRLMDAEDAKALFEKTAARCKPKPEDIPWNKQKGDKKAPAYLTAVVNMTIRERCGDLPCNFNPLALTTVTKAREPLRTLARRVDGAFPQVINPVAVWEIKEYYYTTTFGSRVADGVYETLLDGMELEELRQNEGVHVLHYLIIDSLFTWWNCGRSYLCRIVDMLHMGYVDEVLFGSEVVDRLPSIVDEWIRVLAERQKAPFQELPATDKSAGDL